MDKAHYELLKIWLLNAKKYRELVPTYDDLLARMRELRGTVGYASLPLHRVSKKTINELKQVPLFDIETESEAISYIEGLDARNARLVLREVKDALESPAFVTITNRIIDYNWVLTGNKKKRSVYGYDPDYGGCNCTRIVKPGRKKTMHSSDS